MPPTTPPPRRRPARSPAPRPAQRPTPPPSSGEPPLPDMRRYAAELQAMLRERSPAAYRAFLARWRDIHERGAAERIAQLDDAALRLRLERMILDLPALADLHPSAREYIERAGGTTRGD
jgi:hypothetical protein